MNIMDSLDIMAGYEPKDERGEAEQRNRVFNSIHEQKLQSRKMEHHSNRAFAPVLNVSVPLKGHIRGLHLLG